MSLFFIIFAAKYKTIMAELRQFSLMQLQRLLSSTNGELTENGSASQQDAMLVDNYISQNLAVSRRVEPQIVYEQFKDGPMLMPEMRVLIVTQGWVEPTINLKPYHFEAGQLIFVGRNGIIQVGNISDDVRGIGFSLSDDLFSLALGNNLPKAFDGHLRDFNFHLSSEEFDFLDSIHSLLYKNMHQPEHDAQVTLSLISSFLWYVNQLWRQHEVITRQTQTHEQRIFSDFIQLVNRDAPRQHHVEYYASQLCLTPRYVSTLIRQASGKPPKEWIDEALLTHIKIELKHSDKTVAQISDETNFPNPSFFSKFFKRLTGMTPGEYRESQ